MFFLGMILSYLLGSFPTSFVMGKWLKNIDIRKFGSGNVGAANTFRTLGKGPGLIVWLVDILKGTIPALWLAPLFYPYLPFSVSPVFVKILFGGLAIVGHVYPVFLKFKGGKAVATSTGVFFVLEPKLMAICVLLQFLIIGFTRYFSLGSLSAFFSLTALVWILRGVSPTSLFASLVFAFILFKHRPNIKRLLKGEENKWGKKK